MPDIEARVVGRVVDAVTDVITLAPEQGRAVPKLSAAVSGDDLLAIGSPGQRRLILLYIEKLMASAEMGLVAHSTH